MPDGDHSDGTSTDSSILGGLSRRLFLASGAAVGAGAALASQDASAGGSGDRGRGGGSTGRPPSDAADLLLVNGEIHTMDGDGSVVSSVAIDDGRFLAVGNARRTRRSDTEVVDLGGRTVTPGIVDNHNHVVVMGLRPGYHTPLENADSIEEVQETIADRRPDVPEDRFITTISAAASRARPGRTGPTWSPSVAGVTRTTR